jgi:hypothetical protein
MLIPAMVASDFDFGLLFSLTVAFHGDQCHALDVGMAMSQTAFL